MALPIATGDPPPKPREGEPHQQYLIGVYTMVPPMTVVARLTADTGMAPPDPPLSGAELESIVRAAKRELLCVLQRRAEARRQAAREARAQAPRKFTRPQRQMLLALLREPQVTYGKDRARVQNRLIEMGLAHVVDGEDLSTLCHLTTEGRSVAEQLREAR